MARLNLEVAGEATVVPTAMTAESMFELGLMYSAGRDVEPDMVSAHKWFNLAALRGSDEAKVLRMELARDMSRREVILAQRKAREWLSRN